MASVISLTDDSAVVHNFKPEDANGRRAFYRDWHTDSLDAFEASWVGSKTLLLDLKRAVGTATNHKGRVDLTIPVGYTDANGQPVTKGYIRYKTTVETPKGTTLAERELGKQLFLALWGKVPLAEFVEEIKAPF